MTLKLRGHHLLCLQGFQGYGYNEEFVENMTEIHKKIKENQTTIEISTYADDICKCCPNLINGLCQDEKENKKIVKMDKKVLEKIPKKKNYDSKELFKIINEEFSNLKSIESICFNCKWWEVCIFVKNIENR